MVELLLFNILKRIFRYSISKTQTHYEHLDVKVNIILVFSPCGATLLEADHVVPHCFHLEADHVVPHTFSSQFKID